MPVVIPDTEAMVSSFLRSRSEVTTLVAQRVFGELPKEPSYPAVRITRVAGSPVTDTHLSLDAPLLQLDVFGGTKAQARTIAATCMAVIAELPLTVVDGGYVTGVRFGSLAYQPDDAFSPPKPRYRFDVTVFARP